MSSASPAAPTASQTLEAETGAVAFAADLTRQEDVDALAAWLLETGPVHALVHVAGGARGTDRVEDANPVDWQWMFEVNVLSAQRLVAALLPQLREAAASDGHSDTLFVTSTAAQAAYPGGAGYNAAKAGEGMLAHALQARAERRADPGDRGRAGDGAHRGVHAQSARRRSGCRRARL